MAYFGCMHPRIENASPMGVDMAQKPSADLYLDVRLLGLIRGVGLRQRCYSGSTHLRQGMVGMAGRRPRCKITPSALHQRTANII